MVQKYVRVYHLLEPTYLSIIGSMRFTNRQSANLTDELGLLDQLANVLTGALPVLQPGDGVANDDDDRDVRRPVDDKQWVTLSLRGRRQQIRR